MKTYRWTIVLALSVCTTSLWAQTYAFKVLVSKGKTEVKSGQSWASIKVGANLNASDEVKVSENSYLGLMHASGKPLEVKEAGNYSLADLASKLSKGSTVLNKYTDFILSSDQDKRNKLAATGAVHRDLPGPVNVFLPKTSDHFGEMVSISWSPVGSAQVDVIVMDLGEEELARYKVPDGQSSVMVNINDELLKSTSPLMFKVISKGGNESTNYTIKRLTGTRKAEIEAAWSELSVSFTEKNALERYVAAGFFEEKLLITDALTSYKEAVDLAPEVEMYKEAYDQFLQRVGFKIK
jgi:hypothetical protein